MADRLPRLAVLAIALVLMAGVVASQVVEPTDREARVGTEGPAVDPREGEDGAAPFLPGDPLRHGTTAGEDDDDQAVTTGGRDPEGPTSTTRAPGTTPGTATTTTQPDERFHGPDHLRGRLVYVEDEPANSLHSSRFDGTDRRAEVPCPVPEAQTTPWPAAVSPDGRWVVRTCTSVAPLADPSRLVGKHDLVLQRVDGSETRVLMEDADMNRPALAWSPDGKTIATAWSWKLTLIRVSDGERTTVPIVDVDGNEIAVSSWANLSWSPDGTRLLVTGPTVVDLRTGVSRTVVPVGWGRERWGGGDLTAWAADGSIFFRHRPEASPSLPMPSEPWVRIRLDADGWPEQSYDTLLSGLIPPPNGDHSIEGPVLVGPSTALVVIDRDLFRLDIGPSNPSSSIEPIGALTRLRAFSGWFPTVAR